MLMAIKERNQCSRLLRLSQLIFDEQCRLMSRNYDGLVISVDSQLEAAGRCGYVFHVQAEENGDPVPP
jgi:hypothetical protein